MKSCLTSVRILLLSAAALGISGHGWAQTVRAIKTTSPQPLTLARAETAFLANNNTGPRGAVEFRKLEDQLRKWNYLRLLRAPKGADVIIFLGSPAQTLSVRQGTTGTVLWSASDSTIEGLVKRMKQQVPPSPSVCVLVWCR